MNQEQFKAFWIQLKAPLKAKWEKITECGSSGGRWQLRHIYRRAGEAIWRNSEWRGQHLGQPTLLPLVWKLY